MTEKQATQIISLLQSLDDKTPDLGQRSIQDQLEDIKETLSKVVEAINSLNSTFIDSKG